MSSVSSGINSLIAVVSKDLLETFWPSAGGTERNKLRTARFLAVAIGLVIVGGSRLIGLVPGNLLEVAYKTTNLFLCPMFGLFFLALFVPFSTPFGAILGALYSFAAAVVVGYWDVITGRPGLSFQCIAPVSLAVSLAGGTLLSLLPTRGRSRPALAAYAAAALVPLVTGLFLVWRALPSGRG
jgi:SSS family solute:Na+ symporter